MQAKRVTSNNLDVSTEAQLALFASGQEQKSRLKQMRANALQQAKQERGPTAAEWQKRAFQKLDQAFVTGFYGTPTANTVSANDQSLDFNEWEQQDGDNVQEVQYNLTLVDDILNAGYTVSSSLARTVYTRQRESDWQVDGERSMDGRAQSNNDEAVLAPFGVPLPISHVDYEISARKQAQSQNFGEDIETRKARNAGRVLRETEEDQMLNGWGPTVEDAQGNTLQMYGYKDSSVALTGSASGDWGTASNVLDTIDKLLSTVESQTSDGRGPDPASQGAWLYYHKNQRSDLRAADPRGDGNRSLMQRIQQDYPYLEMKASGALSDGELLMVTKDPKWVEVINAQSPTNLSEEVEFGLATEYKALSCRVPLIKKTYDGIKGVAYFTGA